MRYIKAHVYALGLALTCATASASAPPAMRVALKVDQQPVRATVAELPEHVTITAPRMDERTLDRILIPHFVSSHGMTGPRIDQIGRWHNNICPATQGLQSLSNEFVSRRIVSVARMVAAPAQRAGECRTNVQILFTPHPQEQLDYVTKHEPELLGFAAGSREKPFEHPIQAWYVTRTASDGKLTAASSAVRMGHDPTNVQTWEARNLTPDANPPLQQGPIDTPGDVIHGAGGSRLDAGTSSEFVNVLILVDTKQVNAYSLAQVADYVAMLVLTHTSLGGCNELPSVIDLLSPDCGARAKPQGITAADTAYLKALYASRLETKVSLARGEIHDRMLREIGGP